MLWLVIWSSHGMMNNVCADIAKGKGEVKKKFWKKIFFFLVNLS